MYFYIFIIYFKGALSANDSHTVKAGARVSKSQDISLKLSWEFFGLEHFCFRLKVLEKHPFFAIDTMRCLHRVGFHNVRQVLYQHLFSDGIFLKDSYYKDNLTLRCFSAIS